LRFASLGSGSGGNATLVCCGDTRVLIDCGFGLRETERRLLRCGVTPESLSAVLVTHEHTDHIKGVGPLARKYETPVHMTSGTYVSRNYGRIPNLHLIQSYQAFSVGSLAVQPVPVPHDAREPAQYVFKHNGKQLGILTDLGSITPHVVEAYSRCDSLLVEANHDPIMLATGPYPPSLKARVAGPWGHLSNQQAVDFLRQLEVNRLQHLVVGHISRKNNSVERAAEALDAAVSGIHKVHYACQDEGFDWLDIN
jgi:phosphoribosyl 1,2-cyclic phosphodiesterase